MQEIINMPDNQQHNIEYDVTTLADADSVQVGTSIFSALLHKIPKLTRQSSSKNANSIPFLTPVFRHFKISGTKY